MHPSNVWKAAYESGRRFIEELLIEFAWITKQDVAGSCKPIPSANWKAAITHHNNAVDHKRNENPVAGVGRLNFPGVNTSVTAEIRKVKIKLAASP